MFNRLAFQEFHCGDCLLQVVLHSDRGLEFYLERMEESVEEINGSESDDEDEIEQEDRDDDEDDDGVDNNLAEDTDQHWQSVPPDCQANPPPPSSRVL